MGVQGVGVPAGRRAACYLLGATALRLFVFMWQCYGFCIPPCHIHSVGNLQSVHVDKEMGRLAMFARTSTFLSLVLVFSHTFYCSYLRACGQRAYLLFFLCSRLLCTCFVAAE